MAEREYLLSRIFIWKMLESTEKKTISFSCKVNRPNVTVQWMKAGQEITFSKRVVYRVDKNKHTLIIRDCTMEDEGEYTVSVELNKDRVEVKWMRNNMIIIQGDKYQMLSEGKVHRLQVCEIRPRDQGEYRVVAKDKDARAKLELAGTYVFSIYI
uniref:Ig-like domain-containing protein n=1 Tax=Electrophorus electricus TaxID=8005 RepID=A0AAY5EMD1_ELEEL